MKKLICTMMAIVLMFGLSISAYATEPAENISEGLKKHIDLFFEEDSRFKAIDKNSNDITNEFYNRNINYYINENYIAIAEDFFANLSGFERITIEQNARSTINTTMYKDYYINGSTTSLPANTYYDMGFRVNVNFSYDDGSGNIISYNQPYFSHITGPNIGGDSFSASTVSKSATATKIGSAELMCVSTFNIKIKFQPIGIVIDEEDITIQRSVAFGV